MIKEIVFYLLISIYIIIVIIVAFNLLNTSLPGSGLPRAEVPLVSIAAGGARSMAIMENGDLLLWGENTINRQGDAHLTYRTLIMEDVVAISASIGELRWSNGNGHNMALTSNGDLWIWGVDIREMGRLHNSAIRIGWGRPYRLFNNLYNPVKIMENVTHIAAGSEYAKALTSDGTLWGWGSSLQGQLGLERRSASDTPVRIMEDVIFMSAGIARTYAIMADNTLWAIGNENRKIMEDVIYVSRGASHTMAITSDRKLWAFGNNRVGQLGDGTTEIPDQPLLIMADVINVSAGYMYTMAITSNGDLWGWGSNGRGQLGDGTRETRYSPVLIMENVIAVSTGVSHTLAVTCDGNLWAWGDNLFGQLGDGTTESRLYPVLVMTGVRRF